MLNDQLAITVGTEDRAPRLTRYPDAKNPTSGRTCATAEGDCELSLGATVRKDGSKHGTAMLVDNGNFIDGDSNRYDAQAKVSIALEIPAEGYDDAHVTAMFTGLYTTLTTPDGNGETPLQRVLMGEK